MVLTEYGQFGDGGGGGWNLFGEPAEPGEEPTLEELDPESIKKTIDTLKKFFPYIFAFGVAALVKHFRKPGEQLPSGSLVALSNVIEAFAPIITAIGWVLFTKVNDTAKALSYAITTAETIPNFVVDDLNLPPGIILGSFFVVGDAALSKVFGTDVDELLATGKTTEDTDALDILIATILTVTGLDKVFGIGD